MRHRPSRSVSVAEWTPAIRGLIRAAELECPAGHAVALRELTELAARKLPSRGLFDPGLRADDGLFSAIESIASAHLGLREARSAWRTALDAANLQFEPRDRIEQSALQIQTISDTSYYYAGLAFGLASVHLYR